MHVGMKNLAHMKMNVWQIKHYLPTYTIHHCLLIVKIIASSFAKTICDLRSNAGEKSFF
jgi:hypothetical protein